MIIINGLKKIVLPAEPLQFKIHGNWCGPGLTGGFWGESWDTLTSGEKLVAQEDYAEDQGWRV